MRPPKHRRSSRPLQCPKWFPRKSREIKPSLGNPGIKDFPTRGARPAFFFLPASCVPVCISISLRWDCNQTCTRHSPLSIVLHEHPQHAHFSDGDNIAACVDSLDCRVIGGQDHIAVYCPNFEG